MPYDNALVAAFESATSSELQFRDFDAGTRLYRGGECKDASPLTIRIGPVFLSTKEAYARNYILSRKLLRHGYLYCATPRRNIRLAQVDAMLPIVKEAVNLGLTKEVDGINWQRTNMIELARQALQVQIDGVYMPGDEQSDEVLIDNAEDILRLEWGDVKRPNSD